VLVAVDAGAASTRAIPATAIGMNLRIRNPLLFVSLLPLDVRAW